MGGLRGVRRAIINGTRLPAMIAAGAVVAIVLGPEGRRERRVEDIVTGPGRTLPRQGRHRGVVAAAETCAAVKKHRIKIVGVMARRAAHIALDRAQKTNGWQRFTLQPPASSARTILAPSTIACILPNATSRGRYFMPQSGATMMFAAFT